MVKQSRRTVLVITVIAMVLVSLAGVPQPVAHSADVSAYLSPMEPISENERLALYFHPETAEIAVKDKRDGYIWSSNPPDREQDALATGINKAKLGAQFSLSYYNAEGRAIVLDNYNDSIKNGQFTYELKDNGVLAVTFRIGDTDLGLDEIVPMRISKERYERFFVNALQDEADRREVEKRFKWIEADQVYERRNITEVMLKRLIPIFEKAGYTSEELAIDNEMNGFGSVTSNHIVFTVTIEYRLDGNELVVRLPTDEMKQPESVHIKSIAMLEYFGAANTSQEGYMFVPDGSGSLISLNNGKTALTPFNAQVYGLDATRERAENVLRSETIRLPVFGMKQGNHAMIGIIESGDALASIEADVSGRYHSYNVVYSSYELTAYDEQTLSGGALVSTFPIFQLRQSQGDIAIRYGFLTGDDADYAGMAQYYQGYLQQTYGWSRLSAGGDSPFYLELIGAIPVRKSFLGIPYEATESLTTFSQARSIVEELISNRVYNIQLRYTGWFNGGVYHTLPVKLTPERKLGGEKEFTKLAEYLRTNGIGFYPDVALQYVYEDSWSFSPSRDASRFISRKPAKKYPLNPATFMEDQEKEPYYVLSPARLASVVDRFLQSYKSFGLNGLALRDLGHAVNSDFRQGAMVDRQQSAGIVREQVEKLRGSIPSLLTVGGNALALPYSAHVLEAPLSDSGYLITDESVPFYQMVIHGFIDYAGKPINLADNQDARLAALKALETGSNVYFKWFYDEASKVKETAFNDLYSANYKSWLHVAADLYEEVNALHSKVRDQRMTDHRKLADGVYRTEYENGVHVTVNYNAYNVRIGQTEIQARGYVVGGDRP